MPKATKKEAPKWRFSADEWYPCVLESVEERTISWNDKKDGTPRERLAWTWKFKIVDGEEQGLTLFGDTRAEYTNDENDPVRQWSETLMGRELDLGEDLDTDLLLGLPCLVRVRNEDPRPKRDGTMFYPCPVEEVMPRRGGPGAATSVSGMGMGSGTGWGTTRDMAPPF